MGRGAFHEPLDYLPPQNRQEAVEFFEENQIAYSDDENRRGDLKGYLALYWIAPTNFYVQSINTFRLPGVAAASKASNPFPIGYAAVIISDRSRAFER